MRVLGVDYGRARIGLALSDPTGLFAQGLCVLQRETDSQAVADIVEVIQQYEVEEVVVGLPKNMNGTVGERAEQCKAFAEQLQQAAGIPVRLFDERLTTVAAERLLIAADMRRKRRKQVVDEVAATLLLQSYLDWKQNH
jgi:putative Holliday junction resolvase